MAKQERLGSDPLSFIKDTTNKDEKSDSVEQDKKETVESKPVKSKPAAKAKQSKESVQTVEAVNLNLQIKQLNEDTGSMAFDGELSIYNTGEIKEALAENLKKNNALELELANVSKMDTAGFQLILAVLKEAEQLKKIVSLKSPSNQVLEIFELYGETIN